MNEQIRIDIPNFSPEFVKARFIAGNIINDHMEAEKTSKYANPGDWRWIKTKLAWPAFDHMTFGFKNQVFCVVVDLIKNGKSTASKDLLSNLIRECAYNNLIPCVSRIKVPSMSPSGKGWNLISAEDGTPIRPTAMATEERIPLSEWELDNWAVSIVTERLESDGFEILSYSDLLGYAPQIWFNGRDGKPNWLRVKHSLYPLRAEKDAFEAAPNFVRYKGWETEVVFKAQPGESKIYRNEPAQAQFMGMTKINKGA